jgi:putative transposase
MARPLRVEYPGAVYHVVNRGNQRARVFHTVWHHQRFLKTLEEFAPGFDVGVYCYCLMPNHFHLLLCIREANLSRFMQSLLTAYTVSSNRRDGGAGHVFQGRLKAHLVEAQRYLSEASRYIHLNPVRTATTHDLDLEQRRAALYEFRWSSLAMLIGVQKAPQWIDVEPVLST